jgi:hypothetical protein
MASVVYAVMLCFALQEPAAVAAQRHDYESLVERARSEYSSGRFIEAEG